MNKNIFGFGLLCAILLFFSTQTYAQAPLGEVYSLNVLDVDPIHKGQAIFAKVEVENTQWGNIAYTGANTATVTLTIIEEDGNPVPGITFSPVNVDFSAVDVVSYQFALEGPGVGDYFEVGKTYIAEAEIQPYVDSFGNANLSEVVTGNNRARKTFTIIAPPVTFSIPDMPFALVVGIFSVVLGWLFTMRVRRKHHLKK